MGGINGGHACFRRVAHSPCNRSLSGTRRLPSPPIDRDRFREVEHHPDSGLRGVAGLIGAAKHPAEIVTQYRDAVVDPGMAANHDDPLGSAFERPLVCAASASAEATSSP